MGTRHLSVADVLVLHRVTMALDDANPSPLRGGGDALLESAVMRPQMAEHYEAADLVRQAALLAVGLSQNQPFLDGNKRTAFFAMLVFLDLNGLELESGADEPLAQALIRVAERSGDVESATHRFEAWLRGHIAPRRG